MDVCTWNDNQCVYTCAGYGLNVSVSKCNHVSAGNTPRERV